MKNTPTKQEDGLALPAGAARAAIESSGWWHGKHGHINMAGAADMLDGLDYHYEMFTNAWHRHQQSGPIGESAHALHHEAVAYLNRVGQFRAFARSGFVKALVDGAWDAMPTLKKLSIFRDKHASHRSLDMPRVRDDEVSGDNVTTYHAYAILSYTLMMRQRPGTTPPEGATISLQEMYRDKIPVFQIYDAATEQWIHFVMEDDHPAAAKEGYHLIERLCALAPSAPADP